MSRALAILTAFAMAAALPAADKKKKAADVEIVESAAHRTDGQITIDGKVRNSSEKPIKGLILLFDFMAPGKAVVTTQRGGIEEEVLAPGKEATFRVALTDPVRAVEYRYNATDEAGRDLRVGNGEARPIE